MKNKPSSRPIYEEIAVRLRVLREDEGYTVQDLATEIQIPMEAIEKYESGKVEIPVGYLHAISTRFGVSLTVLISGDEARLHQFCLVRKGEGLQINRRKDYNYKSLAYLFTNRTMEPFQISVPIKSTKELSFNSHPGQEFIYIVKGKLEITLGKQVLVLTSGDSLYFDSLIPHALRSLGKTPAEFIDVIQ